MVRGAAFALTIALACAVQSSVLVPTYVLPPESFVRDQRQAGPPADSYVAESQRTVRRLVGGHLKIKPEKEFGDPAKNSFAFDKKSENGKYVGVVAPDSSGGNVGWNQGIWDDGMLMSSAGEGKESKVKNKEVDEDKKTLSDQVAEGKYGLIQNEIFAKDPKRPGIISYEGNPETRSKDNLQSLGGLKKEEIWLSEGKLLVLKGGSFPEKTQEPEKRPWPAIDDYEAPRRQVKLPQKPKVPPPFPVQLSDNGPLVFLTPNGSVPAAVFSPYPEREGEGPLPPPPFPFFPGPPYPQGDDSGNSTAGGTPYPISPFPFLPGNASEGSPFPFPPTINGSFPDGFPPGAAFLPPPSNQSDLYDEDDPSIYYPPPYNFSYHGEHKGRVPAGPLVPGIVLPPPPDFFAPIEEITTTETVKTTAEPMRTTIRHKPTAKRPTSTTVSAHRKPYKPRPTTEATYTTTEVPYTITTPVVEIVTSPKTRPPTRVTQPPYRHQVRFHNLPDDIITRPKTEKPVYKTRTKVTSKPLSVSVIYDEPKYEARPPKISEPYIIYNDKATSDITDNLVTSTPVPLRAYYSNNHQDEVPTTKLQPVYNRKPTENSLASFYFYDEQPNVSPAPNTFFDGRNYYKAVPVSQAPIQNHNPNTQSGFSPSVDVAYGSFDQADAVFLWPQKQRPRTLTQEYFSIQKPSPQSYAQQPKRPDFYQQIADIQQTIELFTTSRPKSQSHRPHGYGHKPKAIPSRPVYQFSYQSNPRPVDHLPFRAPKLDPEPFRPMVSYSKPIDAQNDFNAITPSAAPAYHQQYLIESGPGGRVTTETPAPSRYYPKTKTREDDYDEAPVKNTRYNPNRIPVGNDKPAGHVEHRYPSTTAGPIGHGYYTKQDERYFDDITKNSFDIFGKKIEDSNRDGNGLGVTPALEAARPTVEDFGYGGFPASNPPTLEGDTAVNHKYPRPINPDSEPVPARVQAPPPPSLLHDTAVNERPPLPGVDPDSEFLPGFKAGEQWDLTRDAGLRGGRRPWAGRAGSLVSYRLPGEGAHVYFLTPQAARPRPYPL